MNADKETTVQKVEVRRVKRDPVRDVRSSMGPKTVGDWVPFVEEWIRRVGADDSGEKR